MKITWILLAIAAGAVLPIQAGLNTRFGKVVGNPAYASMVSFVTGALTVLLYILITRQQVNWTAIRETPPHTWLAGSLGAFFVTTVILAFPRLGPALTFGLIVGGQMLMALALDHFRILVPEQHGINLWRLLGVALIVAGVVILRKF